MTKPHVLVLLLCLFITPFAFAQKPRSNAAAANASWPAFYTAFRAAVNRRDKAAMLRMMPNDFFDGGGGDTASQWLKFIDENAKKGSWRDLQKSFRQETHLDRNSNVNAISTRVTKDKRYYFEYRKNRKWYFAGVVGD